MKNNIKNILSYLTLTGIAFLLVGCVGQPVLNEHDFPGFLMGFIHGFLIVFRFIGSIFMDMKMYSYPNAGVMYDLGYLIGASLFLGGSGASSRR